MKLYYIIDKWRVDKNNGIIVPILEKDNIYSSYNSINLYDKLFDENILEIYYQDKPLNDYRILDIRVFSIYSVETDILDSNFSLFNDRYKYILNLLNENIIFINYKENYLYSQDFQILNWKFEQILCINKNKFKSNFLYNNENNNENNDIKKLLEIIIDIDSPDRLLRLNNILNDFNNNIKNCAKELYEIFNEFSCTDYFDINSEGYFYYNAINFLKDKYNVDEEYS